jgi:hypothetical protein
MNSDMLKDFMPEQERSERIVAAVKSVSDDTAATWQVALVWLHNRPVPVAEQMGTAKLVICAVVPPFHYSDGRSRAGTSLATEARADRNQRRLDTFVRIRVDSAS